MQLLDVAADVVSSIGVRSLTLDAVAEKAGVLHPAVYRHFANVDQLLAAVVDRELASLSRSTAEAVVTAWMDHFAKSPTLMHAALVRPPTSSELRAKRRQQNNASMAFLTGELHAAGLTDVDAEIAAALLLHGLMGVVALWRAKWVTRPVAIDRFVAIVMGIVAGLGTYATASSRRSEPQKSAIARLRVREPPSHRLCRAPKGATAHGSARRRTRPAIPATP